MDNIDKLIKALQDTKEELAKAMKINAMNIARPDAGFGEIIGVGTDKPKSIAPTAPAAPPNSSNKPKPNNSHPYGQVIVKMEELSCSENGQWSIMEKDASDPKLAPKDAKVKQLQTQIDAGKYKPDASKIAGAMLSHPEQPIKKEE